MPRHSASLAVTAALLLVPGVALADLVSGNVLDGTTLKPVANATIDVAGTTVTTDKVGGFKLDLPAGAAALDVVAAGYDPTTDELLIPDGGITDYVVLLYKPGTALETVAPQWLRFFEQAPPLTGRQVEELQATIRRRSTRFARAVRRSRALVGYGREQLSDAGIGPTVARTARFVWRKVTGR